MPAYGSSTDGRACLSWRKSGSLSLGHHEHDATDGADAADADHLDGHVHELEAVEEQAPVLRQRLPVSREGVLERARKLLMRVFAWVDRSGVGFSLMVGASPSSVTSSGNSCSSTLRCRALSTRFWPRLRASSSVDRREGLLDVDARIPDVEHAHLAVLRHVLSVRPHASERRVASVVFAEAIVAAGEHEARGETLHVPLPRTRQRLVEVVDVEDDAPLRRGEGAEVQQMAVTASLNAQAARGCGGRSAAMLSAAPR